MMSDDDGRLETLEKAVATMMEIAEAGAFLGELSCTPLFCLARADLKRS